MAESSSLPVVVGVDGTPAGSRGVRYAALEAQRLGRALQIVHVTPGYATTGPGLPIIPDGTLRSYGLKLLQEAGTAAHALVPGLEVETRLLAGSTVPSLAETSAHASLLVLGAERRSFAGRIWTGDIVAGVTAQASCPTVVVPPEWEPTDDHGRIVIGWRSPERPTDLLAAGFELAQSRGAELVVLHAWKLQSGYDDIVANRVAAEEWGRRETGIIEPLVGELRSRYPDVPVRIEVLHAQPAYALVNASVRADRLLIMRPEHGGVFHHLGAVGRAVLREALCPVEVLPPQVDRG